MSIFADTMAWLNCYSVTPGNAVRYLQRAAECGILF